MLLGKLLELGHWQHVAVRRLFDDRVGGTSAAVEDRELAEDDARADGTQALAARAVF
jgi:hypothetical protein